jgi:hypothetical protein
VRVCVLCPRACVRVGITHTRALSHRLIDKVFFVIEFPSGSRKHKGIYECEPWTVLFLSPYPVCYSLYGGR